MPISKEVRAQLQEVAGLSAEFIDQLEHSLAGMDSMARASGVPVKSARRIELDAWMEPNYRKARQYPSAFSPSAFSPSAFSPSAFSPSAFSPSAFSPSAFSPSAFSPSAFSPSASNPSAFSPSAFSPSAFSPSAFSGPYPGEGQPSTFPEVGYNDPADQVGQVSRELNERFLILSGNILSNPNISDKIAALHELVDAYSDRLRNAEEDGYA